MSETLLRVLATILYKAGNFGMSAVVPVITAGVAYSISDRPGIAPGLILGFICTEIKSRIHRWYCSWTS